jgi:amino acid adenylation domain-containing protein/FkbH-like protein
VTNQPSNLIELLRRRAAEQPDRVAYTFLADGETEEVNLTYGELDRQARAIAAWLQPLVGVGERVLLLYPPGIEYVGAFFGCLYAGAVAVPAYPPRRNRNLLRLQSIVTDAQATVALTTANILARIAPLFSRNPYLQPLRWLTSDTIEPGIEKQWQEPAITSEALAFLQYTSGSTSTPKGVMVGHNNLLHNELVIARAFEQTKESIIVGWLPLYHDMGLIGNVIQPLYLGASCVLMSPMAFLQRPFRWLDAISRYNATTSGGPNFAYDLCVRKVTSEERATLDLSSWRVAFNGSEPIRQETIDRFVETFSPQGFRRESFYPCYGLAEATLIVSGGPKATPPVVKTIEARALEVNQVIDAAPDGEHVRALIGSGKIESDQRLVIVHPESFTKCSPTEVGEIWLAGQSVTQGYWNRPEETERTFNAYLADTGEGPFLRTGDMGFLQDGELFVTGRLKDLIIIRGLNHYPQDIELTVERCHRALRSAGGAAFSVEVAGEERLVIVQEVEHRQRPDFDALVETIKQCVAEEHEAQVYAVLLVKAGGVPKTSSGKIQRHACRAGFLERSLEAVHEWRATVPLETETPVAAAPQSHTAADIEEWLRSQLAARLGVGAEEIDAHRPLTDYALDSLAAIELKHRVEVSLGVTLPFVSFLQSPSVAHLAAQAVERLVTASATPHAAITQSTDTETDAALSCGQQSLWFLQQLAPESTAYNINAALRILSEVDAEALRRAFQSLVDRHTQLRAIFPAVQGQPVQRIQEHLTVSFEVTDVSSWTECALHERLAQEAARPFNLEDGPLLRVSLFTRSAQQHVLLLSIHHIISDFWSLAVLLDELRTIYGAEVEGRPATLAPLAMRYTDYVRWQGEMLASAEGERLWAYWQEQLAGGLPMLELPADRPRPPVQTFRGDSLGFALDARLTAELKALGKSHGATLYMTLLAAFQVLLHRYTSQKELTVGSPTAGRNWAELAGLMGYFVNPLVLRADFSQDPAFEDFLGQVRQTVLAAFEHQDYPFALLVERLQPERDPSRSPLFQAMFALQQPHLRNGEGLASLALGESGRRIEFAGLTLESVALPQHDAQFDLSLTMSEVDDALLGSLQFNTDLFDKATIERMAAHFQTLLYSITRSPELSLSTLALLPEAERRQLLDEWNATGREYPLQPACLHELFEAQVERTPEAIALVYDNQQLTYLELNQRANQLAHYLIAEGIGADQLVGVLMERSVEMVVAMLATLKAGGAYVPLDPAYPSQRVSLMMEDAEASILLTQESLVESLAERVPAQTRLVCVDTEWEQITAASRVENTGRSVARENLAYVIYTSGSTGRPKGVAISHSSAATLIHWAHEKFSASELRCVLFSTSICFDLSIFELFVPLSCGGQVLLAENALQLAELKGREQVTLINTVPSAMAELVRGGWVPESVRTVNLAGEALSEVLVEQVYETGSVERVWNLYGPSEDTTYSTAALMDAERKEKPSIGKPIANTDVYVLNEQMQAAPIGVPGELYIGGEGLARCYLNRPELTAEKFVPHVLSRRGGERLYRTGDLVRYKSNGELEYLGRIDQQVKVRGYRIELGEIEAALRQLEEVREAVVSVRDEGGEKRLIGYLVPEENEAATTLNVRELKRRLQEELPEYMIPVAFVVLKEMPLTPNGKVNRRALPAPEYSRSELEGSFAAARNPVEEVLVGIWAEVLRVESVGIHDNFFDLGGHSLLATRIISRVREAFQIELPLRALFESRTIAGLAELVDDLLRGERGKPLPPLVPTPPEAPLPLSFAQQRLWFLDQLEPGSAAYNIPAAVCLQGQLDAQVLESAMNEVAQRHETLRTYFSTHEGQPEQVILPSLWVKLEAEDLSGESDESIRHSLLQQSLDSLSLESFDLSIAPLWRARLFRLAEDKHVFSLCIHHIISDGWSLNLFMRELLAGYARLLGHSGEKVAEPVIQYRDYAKWQRQWLEEETLERQLNYWREQLGGAPQVLELPTDYARPQVAGHRGASLQVELSNELSESIKAVCREKGVTLYMLLLAAFRVLLWRWSGQKDVLIGSPVAGRTQVEVESLIGFFVNTVVMRQEVRAEDSFEEVVSREREVVLGGYGHQEVPFERIVEELKPERDLSRNPLFQVVFALQNIPLPIVELPGLTLTQQEFETPTTRFDLELHLWDLREGVRGLFIYNSDLFNRETVERMAAHFQTLLQSIVRSSHLPLSRLELLPEAEHQLLAQWNQSTGSYPAGQCLHELFEAHAERSPDAVAVVYQKEQLTYRQLNERANQLAHRLRKLGVGPEQRVGLCLERSVEMVVAMLATLKAGGAYVPLDPAYPRERLLMMLEDARVQVLLTEEHLVERLGPQSCAVLRLDTQSDELSDESRLNPQSGVSADNAAYIIYTSGSTGLPKGVCCRHQGVVNLLADFDRRQPLPPGRACSVLGSFSFDVSVYESFSALLNGCALHVVSDEVRSSSELFFNWIDEQQICGAYVPPFMVEDWLRRVRERSNSCRSLRRVLVGVEPIPEQTLVAISEALPELQIINGYGPTEASVCATLYNVERVETRERRTPIGRPVQNYTIRILDEQMQEAPVKVRGELYIGGEGLARGYWGRPELTAERFVPDPFSDEPGARLYRTGDIARFLEDGNIEFAGRNDYQVKVRGHRIELGEIEGALAHHPAIRESVVLAREDATGEKRLVAYLVVDKDAALTNSELHRYLRERLPAYMVPQAYVLLEQLPLTPNGKVDRRALPEPEQLRSMLAGAYTAPRTPLEEVLCGIWGEVLNLKQVSIHDNFFELGGHSLLATQVISRVRAVFSVELPLRALFECPTVAQLAESIEAARAAERKFELPPLVAFEGNEPPPLSFTQQRLWFLDQLEPGNPVYHIAGAVRLNGRLDVDALNQSLREIVRRHESLRTAFQIEGEQPVQIITPTLDVTVEVEDLSGESDESIRHSLLQQSLDSLSLESFDLSIAPLWRARLFRLAEDKHVFSLCIHHIISDGWSLNLFMRELLAGYARLLGHSGEKVAEPVIQYRDYAKWQRQWLEEETLERQLNYWREQLGGAPQVLELPTDYARPQVAGHRGASLQVELSNELSESIKAVCREKGVTLYMLLLAAFRVLLWRWSGQRDVLIGSPVAGRTQVEVESLIGFFVNTVVMRQEVRAEDSFEEVVSREREVVLGGYGHQEVPFERIVEELKPERDLSRNPLFQVFFNMLNFPMERFELPELVLEPFETPEIRSKFDLTLYAEENQAAIKLRLVYNADLFMPERMAELLAQFDHLLSQIAAGPEQSVAQFSLVTPAAEALLPDPSRPLARDWEGAVQSMFSEQARRVPNRLAVTDGEDAWTYAELERRSNQLANYLRASGVESQDVIAVYGHRSASIAWALLGILKAGAAFVILDPAYPSSYLLNYLGAAQPKGWIQLEAAGALPRELEEFAATVPERRSLMLPRLSDAVRDNFLEFYSADEPEIEVGPEDLAYLIFTSGSTGRPKGVMSAHGPLSHFLRWHRERFGLNELDRFSMLSGLAHDPLMRDLFTPLSLGATLCIPEHEAIRSAGRLAEWMKQEEISVTHLTPALAHLLSGPSAGVTAREAQTLPSLRYIFSGGDVLTMREVLMLRALAPSAACVNFYGATETPQAVGYCVVPRDAAEADREIGPAEKIPVGRGIADAQLLVLNASGRLAGVSEVGEIYVRTPYLAKGYLGDEELTRERFIVNPSTSDPCDRLYRTGDLGRYLLSGEVEYMGRADQQVKLRGYRIEVAEIEAALGKAEGVGQCVVVVRPHPQLSEQRLVAYLTPAAPEQPPAVEQLRRSLREQLPEHMIPGLFVVLEQLPLTPNGKVDKRALPEPEDMEEQSPDRIEPRNEIEETLARIWSEVLGVKRVGINDNFFALGGHSLLAIQVISRLRAAFQVELPLRRLYETSTLAALAESLEASVGESPRELEATRISVVSREQSLPLSYAQQRLWFLNRLDPNSLAYNIPAAVRLSGRLNVGVLEQTFNEIRRRHEILRTTFPQRDGTPFQLISEARPAELRVIDLGGTPASEREKEALAVAKAEAERPFDLASGPLLRTTLLRLDEQEHLLLVTMHHIISDGWSMGVFVREAASLYETYSAGEAPRLPELEIQYADYAEWQRSWLAGDLLQEQLAYWKEQLADAPSRLELPTDKPRPAQHSFNGANLSYVLSPELTASLKDFSQREGATLFMTMLAALKILFFKWSGQEDIVVGTVTANRNRVEVEPLIGCFMNFLALRSTVTGEESGRGLLEQVRAGVLEAYAHQECPFEKIVEAVNPVRKANQNPFYNVAFLLQNYPRHAVFSEGLEATIEPRESNAALLDLRIVAQELDDRIELVFEYDTSLFDAETIQPLIASYRDILEQFSKRPETEVAGFELAGELQSRAPSRKREQTIAITATFTAEPLEKTLAFWMQQLDIPSVIEFAPYNQVFQQLLDPTSRVARNSGGVNVVLVRLEDWHRYESGPSVSHASSTAFEKIEGNALDLVRAVKTATANARSPYLICLCPASPAVESDPQWAAFFRRIEQLIETELDGVTGAHLITASELMTTYPVQTYYDPQGDKLGHIPYQPAFFTALGTMVARKVRALKSDPYKVIVLDCDETLWGGTCGEDGPLGITMDDSRRALQEFMVAQHEAGMLLCLCSKNNEEDVWEVFRQRPEMPLSAGQLAGWRINWKKKSENIRSLSSELRLGLDSFIVIDDNPVECAEIQANCPEALTLQLPPAANIPKFLKHTWAFDRLKTTEEDRKRTAFYQQNLRRERVLSESLTFADFLASLSLEIEISEMKPQELPRVAQLTQRTNQFNMTGTRRSDGEIQRLCQQGGSDCMVVHVRDRFGEYGLVGVIIFSAATGALVVDTFLLSCRVLGRGVEHRMLARLGEIAAARGLSRVDIRYRPTEKNQPALDFLRSIEAEPSQSDSGAEVFTLQAERAAQLSYNPTVIQPALHGDQPVGESMPALT